MTEFARTGFLTAELDDSQAITLRAITVTDITMAINGTIFTVIIIAVGSEVVTTEGAFLGLAL